MAVKIRLARMGKKKNPVYRLVVADQRSKRDGRVIETIGHYTPQSSAKPIVLKKERVDYWLGKGVVPTATVATLLKRAAKAAPTS